MLKVSGGVVYRNIFKIIKELGPDDWVRSVKVEGEGKLLLYVKGGLVNSMK